MSNFVNETTVMKFYIEQLDADNVEFLKGKPEKKQVIKGLVNDLLEEETMNGKIAVACNLWKELFDASLSYISPNKQGYDKIFNYFDAYVEFEELIFASDSFYRDHTLHCIWVYFLGEYFRKNEMFDPLFIDMKQNNLLVDGLNEMVRGAENLTPHDRVGLKNIKELFDLSIDYFDAIFCVSAITHDLGYPLKKIDKINKSIKKVLPFFAINNFDDFTFEYNNIQQGFIDEFIDFISSGFNANLFYNIVVESEDDERYKVLNRLFDNINGKIREVKHEEINALSMEEKELLADMFNLSVNFCVDNSDKNHFLNDFENYQHGIMSAFILYKNLDVFHSISYNKNSEMDLTRNRKPEVTLSLNDILKSISYHTSPGFLIDRISDEYFLTFVDELEEFSRISRASQNREYVKEFCETSLEMDDEGWLNITFEFHNDDLDNLNPEISFKGRCKRFLSLFDIPNLSENLKLRVSCVGKLATDTNTYVLEIANHYADIIINGESKNIPKYLKSTQFFTKEEYATMK